jgi:Tfp pilus assembly protein PilF
MLIPRQGDDVPRLLLILAIVAAALQAQNPTQTDDPAYIPLAKAYQSLRERNYDAAIAAFDQAIALAPDRASIQKDLAYALLKIGETEAARDRFAEAMRLDPADVQVALEFAFLCYETKEQVTARRVFDRLRQTGDATASRAFENIDRPLREGIDRWKQALAISPANYSAHEELARLAEQRDELELSAEHFQAAWRLRPDRRSLLLDLGRVWQEMNRPEDAAAALLAASRGAEPRVAEAARELLSPRYPYVYEFQRALNLDPSNAQLRREFAYLRVEMGDRAEAEQEFGHIVDAAPEDLASVAQLGFLKLSRGDSAGAMPLLEKVLAGSDEALADRVRATLNLPQTLRGRPEEPRAAVSSEARQLAEKSLEKGFLKDALKYFNIAHESDPLDFSVMLNLGRTYNVLKDDGDAVRWFNLARRSPDPATASEASRAYHNLERSLERFRTTVWIYPIFSTRWHDTFAYAQAKTELNRPGWIVHPYASVRFVGDTAGTVKVAGYQPQYLSERSVILGAGIATVSWRGLVGWFEAGTSLRYTPMPIEPGRASTDLRGGLSYSKGLGHLLARGSHGVFGESNLDGIFVSRFGNDMLLYSQMRGGYTFREAESLGGFHPQLLWNVNTTLDSLGQYWANFAESGPGLKFRLEALPAPLLFSVSFLHGTYFVNQGNPRGPSFNDLRVAVWYAFTR